jgi:hypothetical protein
LVLIGVTLCDEQVRSGHRLGGDGRRGAAVVAGAPPAQRLPRCYRLDFPDHRDIAPDPETVVLEIRRRLQLLP